MQSFSRLKSARTWIYLAGFFLTLHYTIPHYINSSFLSEALGKQQVGLIFALGSALAILGNFYLAERLRHISLLTSVRRLLWIDVLALLPLALGASGIFGLIAFLVFYITTILLRFEMDLLLESHSDNNHTGAIRGIFYTLINLAWVISPLLAGFIFTQSQSFTPIYLLAIIAFLPFIYLSYFHFALPTKAPERVRQTWRNLFIALSRATGGQSDNLRRILTIDLLLNFFFSFMVIYLPLYLTVELGFSWSTIGVMFSLMLLPFLVLEWPLGWLADRLFGEKEILIWGLVITAIFTAILPFLETAGILVWTVILIMTRVGASAVEIMKETYFFKNVTAADTYSVSLSRNMSPLGYLLGPLVGTVFLFFLPLKFIFLIPALAFLWGVKLVLPLRDTG